jgi:hypothetical protein
MLPRLLFVAGLFGLGVATVSLALVLSRSFPRSTLASSVVLNTAATPETPVPATVTVSPTKTPVEFTPLPIIVPTAMPSPPPSPAAAFSPSPTPGSIPTGTPLPTLAPTPLPPFSPTPVSTALPPGTPIPSAPPSPAPTAIAPSSPTPAALPTVTVTASPQTTFVAGANWPKKMEVGEGSWVGVTLLRTGEVVITTPASRRGGEVETVEPFPTAIVGPSGELMPAQIKAELNSDFEKVVLSKGASDYCQITDSNRDLKWEWIISGEREPATRQLTARLLVRWEEGIEGVEIWSSERQETEIVKPLFTLGQLQVMGLVSGFVGSALSVPFLYGLAGEVSARRKKER